MEPRWTCQVNDTIGGFIVTTYPHPLSEHDHRPDGDHTKRGEIIADVCTKEAGELLARLLNEYEATRGHQTPLLAPEARK
jgi:hypothetical protein